jgi:hypothetical protein
MAILEAKKRLGRSQMERCRSNIQIGEEDTDIEPIRATFIKATLGLWEDEWLAEGAKPK